MAYKYLNASLTGKPANPKERFTHEFQHAVDELFYLSSDWYTVQEETVYGSGEYSDLDVRINNVVFGRTGMPQGDDFKVLLFKDVDHPVSLGYMYLFDDNYWIVINVTKKSSLATTATVKRCNNMLRWVTSDGALYQQPCSIDYGIKENRDYSTAGSVVVNPSGLLKVTTQLNENTNTIKPAKRFLFGNSSNWTGYRVMGGGIENYNNLVTDQNDISGYLILTMNADFVNEQEDDIVNGIADFNQNVYVLNISESLISGNVSDTIQLNALLTYNGSTVTRNLEWSSSDTNIATVDSSGLVTFVANGTCVITCSLEDNSSISDTCSVTVTSAPVSEYQVVVSPNINFVFEGTTQVFNITLYLNGVAQADTFTFALDSGDVPSENYVYTEIDGNNFSIQNIKYFLTDVLTVNCISGVHSLDVEITLRGKW